MQRAARHIDLKGGSFFFDAFKTDLAVLQRCKFFTKQQAQAGAFLVPRTICRLAFDGENTGFTLIRNTHAVIGYADLPAVAPAPLDQYNAALKKQMTTAIKVEPGVLASTPLRTKPIRHTSPSWKSTLIPQLTRHIYKHPISKKYKATVQHMVKKLELVDVNLIASAKKEGM